MIEKSSSGGEEWRLATTLQYAIDGGDISPTVIFSFLSTNDRIIPWPSYVVRQNMIFPST
jgi:hypothetical protein